MPEFLRTHQKTIGIAVLLFAVALITGWNQPAFLKGDNLSDLARYTGLFGILAVAAACVIVTGGIDLSMGALVALVGVLFPILVTGGTLFESQLGSPLPVWLALAIVLAVSAVIGLVHGLLITKLNLQPFLVTLCGLFVYRGFARIVANDASQGFGDGFSELKQVAHGRIAEIPYPALILLVLAAIVAVFLHRTVWGRHLLALGRNEQAARFSGIATDRMKIVAYVLCSTICGFGGVMFVLETNSALPSNFGQTYELYAIAGAVLGGCSLRGGECSLAGVVLGSAMVQVAQQSVLFLVSDKWKLTVIGGFILVGVIADELLRRYAAHRRTRTA